jgi:hypothetical protein
MRVFVMLLALVGAAQPATAALFVPESDLWEFWAASDEDDRSIVDHSRWQALLDRYLVTDHPSGINLFDYGAVTAEDRQALRAYVEQLEALDPRTLNRAEQGAYWINLYNAVTVGLVIDNYPVKSIRKINGGLLGLGPWNDEVVSIAGQALTLNDIEHRILRPIYRDPRIHYAVNCASLGCPNLASRAFTGANIADLLDAGAYAYVNHPRGVRFDKGKLRVSTIYKWFKVDFGGTDRKLLDHLQRYAEDDLGSRLAAYEGRIRYDYDWELNAP